MKTYPLVFLALLVAFAATSQDKKALKAIEKKFNVTNTGKIWGKSDKVAILGANLRFKIASKQTAATSWKKEVSAKFADYAVLEGVDEKVLQEISDEYGRMLEARFVAMGMEVVPYDQLAATKAYPKLLEKGEKPRENVKKEWGVAQVYSAGEHPFIRFKNADPFGPQYKIPKELDAILVNSMITIDFCHIGINIKQSGNNSYGSSTRMVYTKGSSSVVPAIHIDGHTYDDKGLFMWEDNSYLFTIKEQNKVHYAYAHSIESRTEFVTKSERCESCQPAFAKRSGFSLRQMESGLGSVVFTVDPEKFKAAVIDVLNQYLDQMFALYAAQRE